MAERTQVTTRIPKDLYRKVKIKAAQTGKTITEVLQEMLETWTDDPKEKKDD